MTFDTRNELLYSSSEALEDPAWDAYVASHRESFAEQSSLWAKARAQFGWRPVRLIIRQGDTVVGGAQILERRVARFVKIGYLARGPLLNPDLDAELVARKLREVARTRRLAYLAVTLPYFGTTLVPALQAAGFVERPEGLPPSMWMRATIVIDLAPELDAIYRGMSSTKRWEMRRGQRMGVTVRIGTAADLPVFQRLHDDLCRRRKVASNMPGGPGFLHAVWHAMAPSGRIQMLVAEKDGEPISALILLAYGKWVRAWRIGWSGQHASAHPNVVLYAESIRWAKDSGYAYFDLVGIDAQDARGLVQVGRKAHAIQCPITFFKAGLGGEVMLLPVEYCVFARPVWSLAFRTIGRPLLRSRWLKTVFNRLHQDSAGSAHAP